MPMDDNHTLSHTTWNCKYHIVFAPKYRRRIFYSNNRLEIGQILRELCKWKGVNIVNAEVCPDHVHMLVEIPPKISVSSFMGFLKGKSSLMIYERWGNMKFKYRNRQFWCRGYYVDTVGKNEKKIREYIDKQLRENHIAEQLTLEKIDPFTGNKYQSAKDRPRSAEKRAVADSLIGLGENLPSKTVDIYVIPKIIKQQNIN